MKKNNKAFTLVELLAVIVILGVIMSIASTQFIKIKKNANIEEAKKLENTIKTLGPDVYLNKKSVGNYGLEALVEYGLKSSKIKNPSGNGYCEGYLEITRNKEFIGHICCPGLYQTGSNVVPTDCSSFKR